MAILVKSIEREFLLSTAQRERTSVTMMAGGGEWTVKIISVDRSMVRFLHEVPLGLLGKGTTYDFHYNTRGQTVTFKATMVEPGDRRFGVSLPEKVYKNLSRRFIRMPPPGDLNASFAFAGERYDLDFPASAAFNPAREPEPSLDFNPSDLRGLMAEFERKALSVASERGIVMFKDRKPERLEEKLATSTGRCFYLPTAISGIPKSDPFADRTILTRDDFLQHFLDSGLDRDFAEAEVAKFERSRRTDKVISELIVPILFQDYAIGYATIVNKLEDKPPLDLDSVETFLTFAKVFSWSLKLHGYFKDAPKLDEDYRTQVVDVSAGGLLFACRDPKLVQALKEGTEVSVRLKAKKRGVDASGTIRRHYTESGEAFIGIEFHMMAPEDFRFLFEYLYGRPYTDDDADSVEGVRIVNR